MLGLPGAFFLGKTSSECASQQSGTVGQDIASPEGRILGSYSMTHDYRGAPRSVTSSKAAVASDHGRCSQQGVQIMDDGGNAVDSIVVTALCQGIHNPMASGVGGGHIMVIRHSNGTAHVIDAREVAPRKATKNMFRGHSELSLEGGKAVAVPLELKGLHLAHAMYGSKPWDELLGPSIELAENGFEAHPYLISALQNADLSRHKALKETFFVYDESSEEWRVPKINETCCKRPMLAKLLRDVAAKGPDVLYDGAYSSGLVGDIERGGGLMSAADLREAEAMLKEPLRVKIFGMEFIAPPPPSSAASVLLALRILEGYSMPLAGISSLGHHRVVESLKHAFAIRMSMGDPASSSEQKHSVDKLLEDVFDDDFVHELRTKIKDESILDVTEYGGKWNVLRGGASPDDHGTSHMSAVDSGGMAVSLTSTINTGFGSKLLSSSTGILLNNQMDDFSTPSQSNVYGIPPSESNFISAGKKPMSSMSPLVVCDSRGLRLVIGASGGPRIISAVLQTVLRVIAYGENLFAAVAQPRWHHQLLPKTLQTEEWSGGKLNFQFPDSLIRALERRGHAVTSTDWGAVVQGIEMDETGTIHAVSDPRKDGAPAGI